MKYGQLFLLGFVIHLVLLLSIFDIYFKSPIVPGIPTQLNNVETAVLRVVVISVDGLRYKSLYDQDPETGNQLMPYVLDVIETRGLHGLSETHVPTESRPGHVAMLAGFYEDPSAVTRGWQKNPVDFDSLFNQSSCSFAWGSPDILNIFFEGLTHSCVTAESYNPEEQQFAGNTLELDNWVFNKVEGFLAAHHETYKETSKMLFFLHLLGQDTSGHADKPYSKKYNENLQNVDDLVARIEFMFEQYFPDGRTSYIFTSDHGMTDWGSHGSGDPSETDVPIVAWGSGIAEPKPGLQVQHNISQADTTPLVAILLGIPIPVNSVGMLPLPYLDMSEENAAWAMLLNAQQMTAQLQRMSHLVEEKSLPYLYSQYGKLTDEELSTILSAVVLDINNKNYSEAILKSKVLISLSLEALEYYHNYYRYLLVVCVALSYAAWILYLIICLENSSQNQMQKNAFKNVWLSILFTVTIGLIAIQKLPFSFYFYCLLPEYLWFLVLKNYKVLLGLLKRLAHAKSLMHLLVLLFGVEMLVYGFFYRWTLSLPVFSIVLWPVFSGVHKVHKFIFPLWFVSGVFLGCFTLLPVIGKQPQLPLISCSGGVLFMVAALSCIFLKSDESILMQAVRCLGIALATWNSSFVHSHFETNHVLLLSNQCVSWFLLLVMFPLMVSGPTQTQQRLRHILMSLTIPFLLLTVSHEGFFILALFIHLYCWMHIEQYLASTHRAAQLLKLGIRDSHLSSSDFRLSFFFHTYISIGFFGIGNIANLNSFDPVWVRCFLTMFSPFLMSSLILFKTIIPFLAVISSVVALAKMLDLKTDRIFILVLVYSNIMGLNFLFLVTNKGSWMEIGTSISHYVIQQVTVLFLLMLYGLAHIIMTLSLDRVGALFCMAPRTHNPLTSVRLNVFSKSPKKHLKTKDP